MRKFTFLIIVCAFAVNLSAQDIIAAWRFTNAQLIPDESIALNANRFLGTEDDQARPTYFKDGQQAGDTAAVTIGWDAGVGTKYWLVKFKTEGYENIKISSKQFSEAVDGPKDFVIQWKTSGDFADLTTDTIHVSNDWTTGVITEQAMPSDCNNMSSNVSVRWIMSSDLSLSNAAISATAESMIDDIVVIGTAISTGLTEYIYVPEIKVVPNPSYEKLTVTNLYNVSKVVVNDISGKVVYTSENISNYEIQIENLNQGLYFINCYTNDNQNKVLKAIVQ